MAMVCDEKYMRMALEEAKLAAELGEIPVGAVVIAKDGTVLARTHNLCETNRMPTDHAELLAVRAACKRLNGWRLSDCTVYVTLEPCPMCMGAMIHARVKRIVFGASDPRAGACGSLIDLSAYPLESSPEIQGGVLASESLNLLRSFFSCAREKRENQKQYLQGNNSLK